MRKKFRVKESYRRGVALTCAYCGWGGALTGTYLRVTNTLPLEWGSLIVLFLGIGMTGTVTLSRMRLAGTITHVFEAGLAAAVTIQNATRQAGGPDASATIICDLDGNITSVDRGENIGWPNSSAEQLVGHSLDDYIPAQWRSINDSALEQYRLASKDGAEDTGVVVTFRMPLLGWDGKERPVRLTITRLGDSLVKTIVPLGKVIGRE